MSINIAAIANAWYSNSRNHTLVIMNSGSARASWWNFLFWHVFYRVHSSFRSFDNYRSYQMDFWGAFECTRLVETVLHLKTGLLGNQENSIEHNFVTQQMPMKWTSTVVTLVARQVVSCWLKPFWKGAFEELGIISYYISIFSTNSKNYPPN